MFRLDPNPEVTWPVKVIMPADGGKSTEGTFNGRFRVLGDEKINAFFEGDAPQGNAAMLRVALIGADDVIGPDGAPLAFTDTLRDSLIDNRFIRAALIEAYTDAMTVRREKN